jgi:hypothetical protein
MEPLFVWFVGCGALFNVMAAFVVVQTIRVPAYRAVAHQLIFRPIVPGKAIDKIVVDLCEHVIGENVELTVNEGPPFSMTFIITEKKTQ